MVAGIGAGSHPPRALLAPRLSGLALCLAAGLSLGGAVSAQAQDSLRLELSAPPNVSTNDTVRFVLHIENRSGRPLDLYLRGRSITVDVTVMARGGDVVWRRLENEIVPAVALLRTLGVGERIEVTASWDQRARRGDPVPPGVYTARAALLVEQGVLESEPVTFRVVR